MPAVLSELIGYCTVIPCTTRVRGGKGELPATSGQGNAGCENTLLHRLRPLRHAISGEDSTAGALAQRHFCRPLAMEYTCGTDINEGGFAL